ncbi:MAG: hypothetical protein ABJA74_11215 [Lapillicoccus sp.]
MRSVMSVYAGRHRDAMSPAPVAPVAPDRRGRRAVLGVAVAVAVVGVGLVAYPTITRVQDERAGQRPATAPSESGLQLLARQGDAADQHAEVGAGDPTTTDPVQSAQQSPTEAGVSAVAGTPGTDRSATGTSAFSSTSSRSTSATSSATSRSTSSATLSSTSSATSSLTSVAAYNARAVGRAMLPGFGFADSEFGCLNAMWTRLDRWGSAAQTRSGLAYIQKRYGTPCAAWAHVRETGEY